MVIDKMFIQTGNFFELYTYKTPFEIDKKYRLTKSPKRPSSTRNDLPLKQEYVQKSTQRAKNKIRRLIVGNMWAAESPLQFVTLTFKDNVTDLLSANYEFQKYRQRMSTKIKQSLSYVAVPEIQNKRLKKYGHAVWHYHMITFNQPKYSDTKLESIWGNGFCDGQTVYKTDGTGNYLTKYLTKSYADQRMKGKKRYYNAVNHQPRSIYHPKVVDHLHHQLLTSTESINDYPLYVDANKQNAIGHKYEFVNI